ncbi:transposase [Methanosarcina sp. UBA5]|uniref:transposase n=1 Tax=Methanosarcina sp. UBA5 TaxID=1915593 RepID=UPI0025F693A4|nr:transposase [Methanosarcina sp. UBA5]
MSKKRTKCTPELTAKAVELIREGFTYSQLAAGLGISEDTLYLWFRKAKQDQAQPYLNFYNSVKISECELLSECLQSVKASMKHDPKAAFFMLERRFSSDYGKTSQVNMTSQNVNMNYETKSDKKDADKIRAEILAKLAPKSSLKLPE